MAVPQTGRTWGVVKKYWAIIIDSLAGPLFVFFIITTLFILLITISITVTYLSLSTSAQGYPFFNNITRSFTYLLVDSKSITEQTDYASLLSYLLTILLVLVTFIFGLTPLLNYFQQRRERKKNRFAISHEIYEPEKDDLEIMYKHFSRSEMVKVISGDYSWICKHQKLKDVLIELAQNGKLKLISYKSQQQVVAGIANQNIFNQLRGCFSFENQDRILKCSYVTRPGLDIFLYRYTDYRGGDICDYVFELRENQQTKYLFQVLEHILNV